MGQREEISCNREFWEKVLGKEVCESLAEEVETKESPGEIEEYNLVEKCYENVLTNKEECIVEERDMNFYPFYRVFGQIAVVYAAQKEVDLLGHLKGSLLENLYQKIVWIPMRVLIQDIHKCKDRGILVGGNSEEEYADYCNRYLNDRQYIKNICDEYPEMKRLLLLQIMNLVLFLEEIIKAVKKDRKEINNKFFNQKAFHYIDQIDCGQADVHKQGRTVTIVYFDNGCKLVYKPRSLKKEVIFEQLYSRFCACSNLTYNEVQTIDCQTYGWQEFVEYRECKNQEEVERYFNRMGILLFLCYYLNASDIHGENIIVAGEQPVLIDLETLPGIYKPCTPNNAEELVREEVKMSVLSTGMLPVYVWQQNGKGTIVSALHETYLIESHISIPIVLNKKTSDIYVGYRKGVTNLAGSMLLCDGRVVAPSNYVEQICRGYENSYRYYLKNKEEINDEVNGMFELESRYLIRHTQQYRMLIQMSLYPEFLQSEDKRKLILRALDNRQIYEEGNREFIKYERNAMYQLDVPYFSIKGTSTVLVDGNNNKYENIVEKSILECWNEKYVSMGEKDLIKQNRFIKLSMALLGNYAKNENELVEMKSVYEIEKGKLIAIEKIAEKICDHAIIYEEKDINFCGLHFQDEKNWNLAPMGMYLYDGIAGVAIFLAAVTKYSFGVKYEVLYKLVCEKMFRYTENLERGMTAESQHIGAFVGEGSIVNAYLLLYKITGNELFLEYGKRHCEIVISISEKESCMDFLAGCAGAIVVILKLFHYVKNEKYIRCARRLEERLWNSMQHFEEGCGWSAWEGKRPLAGVAHGNSGIILAYSYLLDVLPEKNYIDKVQELLRYEKSLYDDQIGSWKDLRKEDTVGNNPNAWCYGATGIMLVRLKLLQHKCFSNSVEIVKDLERCRKLLLENRSTMEMCLCHGLAGDYWATEIYCQNNQDHSLQKSRDNKLKLLLEKMNRKDPSRGNECESFSLMMGIVGVGLAMCEENVGMELLV